MALCCKQAFIYKPECLTGLREACYLICWRERSDSPPVCLHVSLRANGTAQRLNAMLNEFPERPGVINVMLQPPHSTVVSWILSVRCHQTRNSAYILKYNRFLAVGNRLGGGGGRSLSWFIYCTRAWCAKISTLY